MKVLVADDHGLFREGIRHVLAGMGEPVEVLEAADGAAALHCAAAHADLDLVLLDLNMPDMNGFAALELLGDRYPGLPVVILSAETRRADMQRALDLGAMGFVPKDSTGRIMIQALRLVLAGGIYVPPALAEPAAGGAAPDTPLARLTDRQREVLTLLAQGQSNKEIARSLALAEATVKMHVTAIMKALGVSNRTQAVVAAKRLQLV
ncbi:MAG TPA: response regulator transcription factor [Acidiferrobacterales bacterium]|jgi:DNA-binding NarL/FixJ family response regulator